ncbi:MAG: hypothetical protein BM558_00085 [Roseobacter sp. MedPE-SW]|nr:MAG: hypothetical protein BM558_00085 [Roseobacter sp. MedPE-SW]
MKSEQNRTPGSGMRPWLKGVLALSLALNLIVVGIGAGAAWRFHGSGHKMEGPPMLSRFIFKDMGGREVHRLVLKQAGETGNVRNRRRAEMEQIIALIRAKELDVTAVRSIVEAHIVENNGLMRTVAEAWEQRLEGLSLKERSELADRMQHRIDHPPRKR